MMTPAHGADAWRYSYLYVDDDALSREIMQMIMGQVMGITRLALFADSTDFIERIHSLDTPPDVVLLDIRVTPYDGFAMLRMLRADECCRSARVVAMTASVMHEQVERMRRAGFDGAIAKPVDLRLFPALLADILKGQPVWHVG